MPVPGTALIRTLLLLAGGLTLWTLAGLPLAGAEAAPEEVFQLRGASAFDLGGREKEAGFLRGQSAQCQDQAPAEVKTWPALKSKKPVYGSVRFGGDPKDKQSGMLFHFAVDEDKGTGQGYDRLYFDANQDLNLQNDPALAAQRNPPGAAKLTYSSIKQQAVFEPLLIEFDFGPDGKRRVEILPRLAVSVYDGPEYKNLTFIRTRLFRGDIKVAGQKYSVLLGNDYFISGRLDTPGAALILSRENGAAGMARWWGGDRLMALHRIEGRFFSFAASPTGDRLFVRPYGGDVGTFAIGPGQRKLDKLTVTGSLQGQDKAVAVGADNPDDAWPKAARACEVPAGDYLPSYLTIEYGRLRINVSQNYHSEGKARDRGAQPPVYGFHIRKDKPCLLDFSNQPEVMFASPAAGSPLKRGDTLLVAAVLVDAKLDFMVRGLEDTTRKQNKDSDGKALGYERNVSLDPKVVIKRSDGKVVAEGAMPFG
jgi:hypothetical protein